MGFLLKIGDLQHATTQAHIQVGERAYWLAACFYLSSMPKGRSQMECLVYETGIKLQAQIFKYGLDGTSIAEVYNQG